MTKTKLPAKKQISSALFFGELLLWGILFVLCILSADKTKAAMLDTLAFCTKTVVPTIFPFMILSALLMQAVSGKAKNNDPKLFAQGSTEPFFQMLAFVVGALCGFPIGAQIVNDLYNDNKITKAQAKRLFPLSNQCSLAFVTLGVGDALLGSQRQGLYLYIIMILSSLLVFFLFPTKNEDASQHEKINKKEAPRPFVHIVRDATLSTLYTVGFLLLFSIPIALLESAVKNDSLRLMLTLPLEFTGACRAAIEIIPKESILLFPTLATILSFGGICVGMQSELIVKSSKLNMRNYYLRKLLQGAFAFLIALVCALLR